MRLGVGGAGVVLPMEKDPKLICHFSADTRCLDGVNRKVVCNGKCVCGGWGGLRLSFQRAKQTY